jgi:hypothetical protein
MRIQHLSVVQPDLQYRRVSHPRLHNTLLLCCKIHAISVDSELTVALPSGSTWTRPSSMTGMGCARPRLKRLGNRLLLSGSVNVLRFPSLDL